MALNEVMEHQQKQNIYRIQQQYDFESLQNLLNQKIIHRHRIIIVVSMVAIFGLMAFALSRVRLAQTRKEEAEAKANLFHFMQQNKELTQQRETEEKTLTDLSMTNEATLKAYHELVKKHEETQKHCMDYVRRLSDVLNKDALVMRKLDIYTQNTGDKMFLAMLDEAVFEGDDHWEAMMKVFDTLYPGVRANLNKQHPELTEMEQKDFILSYFNVSREDEALMFKKSVHAVDRRNSVRKKMQSQGRKTS